MGGRVERRIVDRRIGERRTGDRRTVERRTLDERQIGAILVEVGAITPEELAQGLLVQANRGGRIGEILVGLEYVSEHEVLRARALQLGMDPIRISDFSVDTPLLAGLPPSFLAQRRVLPLRRSPDGVQVAIADPARDTDLEFLAHYYGRAVVPRLAEAREVLAALHHLVKLHPRAFSRGPLGAAGSQDAIPGRERPKGPRRIAFDVGAPGAGRFRWPGKKFGIAIALLALYAILSNLAIRRYFERLGDPVRGTPRENPGAALEGEEGETP